jgi:hypothetical protein
LRAILLTFPSHPQFQHLTGTAYASDLSFFKNFWMIFQQNESTKMTTTAMIRSETVKFPKTMVSISLPPARGTRALCYEHLTFEQKTNLKDHSDITNQNQTVKRLVRLMKISYIDRMNAYQTEQLDALTRVLSHFENQGASCLSELESMIADYIGFRHRVADFLNTCFKSICTVKCYQGRLSACCARDGIITFFADVVINAIVSSGTQLEKLKTAIIRPYKPDKCIFLTETGCTWQIKPVVCEFFLCDAAERQVFQNHPDAQRQWEMLTAEKNAYTWPDRPVLFERIENEFIIHGCQSPLMYLHNSPGLVRIRRARDRDSGPL